MQTFRLYIENSAAIISNGPTSSLFNNHGKWGCFIEQAQLAFGFLLAFLISGIQKNAALNQVAMEISYKGTNIAQTKRPHTILCHLQPVNEVAGGIKPVIAVCLINTVIRAFIRNRYERMGKEKLAHTGI